MQNAKRMQCVRATLRWDARTASGRPRQGGVHKDNDDDDDDCDDDDDYDDDGNVLTLAQFPYK